MSCFVSLVLLLLFLLGGDETMAMEEEELLGLYSVMDSLLEDSKWSENHPFPCTDTPFPGIQCEISNENIFHITKIHIGPDILDPPCKSSASLSNSFSRLKFLKTLSIFNCFVSPTHEVSLSTSTLLASLSSLEHLALVSNPSLVGKIPKSLGCLGNLRVLSLSQNSFHGEIPDEIGELVHLEQLDLSYNNFSGEIPEKIGGLKRLSILDLSWNGFEGRVPYTLGHLESLEKIDLGHNKLISRVPQELGALKRLVLFDLSHNFITGPIPKSLSKLDQLEYFIIDKCPINTGIPLFLRGLKKLTTLSLSGCGFTGAIPNFFPFLKNLTSLFIDNNALEGTIPPNLGTLPHLDQLNLSQNQLSGELLLQEEFVSRLGMRLDVRGNNGLCKNNKQEKSGNNNSSMIFGILPTCLESTSIGNSTKSWVDDDEEPNGIERVRPPSWYHEFMTSNSPRLHEMFMSPIFVFWVITFLMM